MSTGLSAGTLGAVSDSAYTSVAVKGTTSTDIYASDIPANIEAFGQLVLTLTGVVGTPAQCTVKVTWDSAGDHILMPPTNVATTAGETTATTYTAVHTLPQAPLRAPDTMVSHTVYVWVRFAAGSGYSATAGKAKLHWKNI